MAACPSHPLLRRPLEAVERVVMLTVQGHIGIPDPSCEAIQLPLLAGCSQHSLSDPPCDPQAFHTFY